MKLEEEKSWVGKWWMFITSLVVLTLVILNALGYLGKITSTAVEREVFEQSYQKQAGDKAKLNTYKAQLISIKSQINNQGLDEGTKAELLRQKNMIEQQINSTKMGME
jgi:Tfp pilus assembly protein PilO